MRQKTVKRITKTKAANVIEKIGPAHFGNDKPFYATDGTDIWGFESEKDADVFVARENNARKVAGWYADGHPQHW